MSVAPEGATPNAAVDARAKRSACVRLRERAAGLRQLLVGWDVFISYSRSDARDYALALRAALARRGLSAFLDQRELTIGDKLSRRLRRAARASSLLVILVTPGATAAPKWIVLEARAAATSWLRPARVPIAFPPARGGALGDAFTDLDDALALEDTSTNLAGAAPPQALVAGLRDRLGRRRLRQRRWVAAICATAVLAAGAAYQQHRAHAAERDLRAQHWVASAAAAADAGRYDLAEYGIARASEIGGATARIAVYRTYRAHRALTPVSTIPLDESQQVVAVQTTPHLEVLVADDVNVRLVGPNVPPQQPLECAGQLTGFRCDGRLVVGCGAELVDLSVDKSPIRTRLAGDLVAMRCQGPTIALLTSDRHGLALATSSGPSAVGDAQPVPGSRDFTSAGLCGSSVVIAWYATVRDQAVFVTSPGAPAQQLAAPGLVTATVHASPACDRFFVEYGRTIADDPLQPLGATVGGWAMLESATGAPVRALPADVVEVAPSPTGAASYGLARTESGQLLRLPQTDAVMRRLEPEVVASGVTDLVAWPEASDSSSRWTVSLESDLVVVRDDGALVARVPARVDGVARLRVSGDAVVVEGVTTALVFTRAAPATPDSGVPSAREVAAALGLAPDELASYFAAALAPR